MNRLSILQHSNLHTFLPLQNCLDKTMYNGTANLMLRTSQSLANITNQSTAVEFRFPPRQNSPEYM